MFIIFGNTFVLLTPEPHLLFRVLFYLMVPGSRAEAAHSVNLSGQFRGI